MLADTEIVKARITQSEVEAAADRPETTGPDLKLV